MFKRSISLATLIAISMLVFFTVAQNLTFEKASAQSRPNTTAPLAQPIKVKAPAPIVYGIPTDSLEIVEATVKRGENLSEILDEYNITLTTISELAKKSRDVFNVRRISANRNYTILHLPDSGRTAQYFIYEPCETEYVIYDLRGELNVTLEKRKVDTVERAIAGIIQNSLFDALTEAGGSAQLVNHFADIYAWRLDLNRIQPGDKFKLIYDEHVVNGKTIGFGKIKSAYFEHEGTEIYAIGFQQGKNLSYYDQDGKSLKRAFLREPLEYSRVSSRFSKKRFHPVQKRYKPHLGTDFAARYGTPIRTVGDGVVLEAKYSRGNGYYVKIKHNKTYTTQYLHMSKFAKGMRAGKRVKQGQTIGYVGSTGLATGPHLCYRFWKNGKQVDALRVKLPSADPVSKKYKDEFDEVKDATINQMQAINEGGSKSQQLLASDKQEDQKGA
ncbi:peptidoglycan DD-metalloendopeptidase family protein [Pontibacter sp. KCTC 32443]|uniref:peptidoglycan DD-metalloendopeptidase family protein n=1 Tax=Pontibacter TaxID=323449 RepID=UPI00164E55B8|nr:MULTISPECIES: peptidoglycan DD-metalloendopeptidase family protein [Pontibacter]MBC5772524.1 peptidoglycan DD-metalloendopeptidase family protein [Pontibacter sp. KCTC 32443]